MCPRRNIQQGEIQFNGVTQGTFQAWDDDRGFRGCGIQFAETGSERSAITDMFASGLFGYQPESKTGAQCFRERNSAANCSSFLGTGKS